MERKKQTDNKKKFVIYKIFFFWSATTRYTLRQGLKRKLRKGGGIGAQGAAERPEEATARDHEPHGQRLRSCSGKPDGEQSEPGRPKKENK